MSDLDDFRMRSHELLLDLDSATCSMMMLVSSRTTNGPEWSDAVNEQHACFERWMTFINYGSEQESL